MAAVGRPFTDARAHALRRPYVETFGGVELSVLVSRLPRTYSASRSVESPDNAKSIVEALEATL
jgi:hypothetical protein